ncbi:MAG TPA: histidine phosphatase family protein [Kineosporiaceae bacterium]|nr:histidine phosphatase family protein [Kineosporiaceae bacterium]
MTADRVICWRHGRTAHNHSGTWQGQLDIPLDDTGRTQAAQAAEAIAASVKPGDGLTVVSSDLARARVTAESLAAVAGVEVRLDRRLREIDAGRWQGLTKTEIVEAGMGDELAAWQAQEDIRIGGGERRSEVSARGAEAIQEHAAALDGGALVVVAHGGLLRGSIVQLLGLDGRCWNLLGVLGNGQWAELFPGQPAWRLVAYNLAATPIGSRFGSAPHPRDRLSEPQR